MPSTANPLVYLILGAAGSGRRELLADLIEGGLGEKDRAGVFLAEGEPASAADTALPNVSRWSWRDGTIAATPPAGATHIFLVTDGRANPMDQIEAFKSWLATHDLELARVLSVVNCALAEQNPALLAWFDACAHFADVVLLNRREGVANKWLSDFIARYRDQYYPCLFEQVKSDRVKNPALVLDPHTRRMAQFFEAEPDWRTQAGEAVIIEDEGDDEDSPETDGDEDADAPPAADPWLARDTAGRRLKPLPDIAKFLPSA
jgi:hypothetical protein